MGKSWFSFTMFMAAVSVVIVAGLVWIYIGIVNLNPGKVPEVPVAAAAAPPVSAAAAPVSSAQQTTAQGSGTLVYNPPKPEEAPQDIREAVLLGYNVLTQTKKYAPDYVGNGLACTNCHFNGGISEGGKNGGLSLTGIGATYPRYQSRQNYSVDLVMRTQDCFQRSMNGKAPPVDSKEMQSIVVYFQWISKGIPVYSDVPWLGIKKLSSTHQGDPTAGKQVFDQACAACHGADGLGTAAAPPLWGPNSFNDGAGMYSAATMAAFVNLNMPKGNPTLTEEQSLDVAAYVVKQPRPHFQAP